MADGTKIEWADATWNPIVGCSVVSPGCTNCYAMRLAGTRLKHHPSRAGLTTDTKAGPVWTGETRFDAKALVQPLRWRRPRKIFVCAHSDLFHPATPDEWIDCVVAIMALCPQHTFQVLTKRPERMRDYLSGDGPARVYGRIDGIPRGAVSAGWLAGGRPLPNVWLGVTAEDQTRADERIPDLLGTPAAKRFVSVEPMLGALNLRRIRVTPNHHTIIDALEGYALTEKSSWSGSGCEHTKLDWVICGGESGPGARPMHPDWARSLRDQCAAANVPFFMKQWGEWGPTERNHRSANCAVRAAHGGRIDTDWMAWDPSVDTMIQHIGKRAAGRLLDGVEHNGMPEI